MIIIILIFEHKKFFLKLKEKKIWQIQGQKYIQKRKY